MRSGVAHVSVRLRFVSGLAAPARQPPRAFGAAAGTAKPGADMAKPAADTQ